MLTTGSDCVQRESPMSPLDQVLWRIQSQSPHQATIVVLVHLEGAVEHEQFVAWHQDLITLCPRFTHRPAGTGRRPAWQRDPHFTLSRHALRVSLPGGTEGEEFEHLLHGLANTSLPPDAAPWQAYLIEGASDGGSVYLLKIAHSLADGLRLMYLLRNRRPPVGAPRQQKSDGRRRGARADRRARMRLWYRLGADSLLPSRQGRTSYTASAARQYTFFTLPLAEMKRVARETGGTANDVLLCALTRGISQYRAETQNSRAARLSAIHLVGRAHLPAPHAGNNFTFASLALPAGQGCDVKAAVQSIREAVKASGGARPADAAHLIAKVAPALPTRLLLAALATSWTDMTSWSPTCLQD